MIDDEAIEAIMNAKDKRIAKLEKKKADLKKELSLRVSNLEKLTNLDMESMAADGIFHAKQAMQNEVFYLKEIIWNLRVW